MLKFCPDCGTRLVHEEANFCPECGYSLTIETAQVDKVSSETKFDTSYPLPDNVQNFQSLIGNQINFQTSLSLGRITTFYQRTFAERGLTEIESLTNITEESISLVFKGTENDNVIVLQAIDLPKRTDTDLRNVNLRTEKRSWKKHMQPRKYEVYVDDNFHYMDESERYKLGEFETCEEATTACKRIVDEFLEKGYEKGMSFKELYDGYIGFGEDPFIISDDKTCFFSAWDYAKERCRELCGEEK